MASSSNKISHNLLLLGIVCIILFLLLEVFLRVYQLPLVVDIQGTNIILNKEKEQWKFAHNFSTDKLDEFITVKRNSIGFRGEDPPKNFLNKLTIFAVGGSTTYNAFISEGKTWVDILGKRLRKNIKELWINNAGFNGQSTKGHINLLKYNIVDMKPKIILFLVGTNDSVGYGKIGIDQGWVEMKTKEIERYGEEYRRKLKELESRITYKVSKLFGKIIRRLSNYSKVVAVGHNFYRNIKAYKEGKIYGQVNIEEAESIEVSENDKRKIRHKMTANKEIQEHFKAYEDRLKELIRLSKNNNIEPIFITQPALYGNAIDDVTGFNWGKVKIMDKLILDGELLWEWEELINDITRKVAVSNNLLVIDLAKLMPKSSRLYIDLLHYSNEGNKVVANIIYDKLCPYIVSNYNDYVVDSVCE